MDIQNNQVKIVVTDNGIGMAPDLVARAFELFTQAKRTADRAQGGLGIGLALVKSLVELHQGQVSVHSKGPGEGSEFTVYLPRLDKQTEQSLMMNAGLPLAARKRLRLM